MIARPSTSSVLAMSPMRTPATRTVWPWPGMTACAVANSAFSVNGLSLEQREAQPLVVEDVQPTTGAIASEADDRE